AVDADRAGSRFPVEQSGDFRIPADPALLASAADRARGIYALRSNEWTEGRSMTPTPPSMPPHIGNPTLTRAVRGPLLLIVVGVLFAIDNSAVISFGRPWPVLLIVFGVFKLIDMAEPHGQ